MVKVVDVAVEDQAKRERPSFDAEGNNTFCLKYSRYIDQWF